jgi:methylated-DNA-[protein]-cysteine S-methyltransferase
VSVTSVGYAVEGWGEGELWFDGTVLVWHELPAAQRPVREADRGKGPRETGRAPEVRRIVHAVERYFHGERVDLASVRLELDDLTPFQRAIAEALRRVPWGEIVSYRDLAHAAGYANAQRAAGTFCARNRFPLFLPCHRVVSANGLGGYGSLGSEYKRRLLELEGVTV